MKRVWTAAVLLGLAVYLVAFYATSLPTEEPVRRIDLLGQIALLPDNYLLANWFGSPAHFSLIDRLPVLFIAGAILIWAVALGWLVLLVCRETLARSASEGGKREIATPSLALRASVNGLTRLETFVFSMAVGLATLSTLVLLLGLAGLLDRTSTFAIPFALTLVAAAWTWRCRNSQGSTAPGILPTTANNDSAIFSVGWLWLAVPFVVAILLAAMLPPFEFDVCEYHLQAPKEFYQQGRITFLPHNVYANMPMGAEMLSLLAMVIVGDWWLGALAGKVVLATFTPLCALGLFAAGRRFYSTTVGVAAAVLFISTPWFASTSILPSDVNVSSSGLVEGALACYLFLAVFALVLARKTLARSASEGGNGPQCSLASRASVRAESAQGATAGPSSSARGARNLLLLAGYLAGAAVATKYPAVLLVLLPLAVWIFLINSRGLTASGERAWGRRAKRVSIFLLAAAVACGPWFAKNWALTGNPVYPLLYSTFGGKTWNADKDARWNRIHRPHDFSAATLGKDLGRVALTSPWISPLVVPFAALALLTRRRSKSFAVSQTLAWQLVAYVAFVIAVWWLLTHRIDRFWIPVLPVLTLLAGVGVCWRTDQWWRWTVRGLLVIVLAANFLVAAAGPGNAWFVPLRALRADARWVHDPWHRWFNDHATGDGVILTVGDAAVFDLRRPVLYSTCFDDCVFERIVKGKSALAIRAELAARHIAYVYVNWSEIERYRSPGNYGFTHFVEPSVFDRLMQEHVLAPLPLLKGERGRAYRVL